MPLSDIIGKQKKKKKCPGDFGPGDFDLDPVSNTPNKNSTMYTVGRVFGPGEEGAAIKSAFSGISGYAKWAEMKKRRG